MANGRHFQRRPTAILEYLYLEDDRPGGRTIARMLRGRVGVWRYVPDRVGGSSCPISIRDTLADVERRDGGFGGFTDEAATFWNILSKPWEMTLESGQPSMGPECPDHHALPVRQNEPTDASPANVEASGRTDGIVDARSLSTVISQPRFLPFSSRRLPVLLGAESST